MITTRINKFEMRRQAGGVGGVSGMNARLTAWLICSRAGKSFRGVVEQLL